MKNILQKIKQIKWRRGSGSAYVGVAIMLTAFAVVAVVINVFNMFYAQTRTQLVTDIMTDGGSVAAINPGGFDEEEMRRVAKELVDQNDIVGTIGQYSISAHDEVDSNGNVTGYKIVTGNVSAGVEYFIPRYLTYEERFQTSATAVVRAEIPTDASGWITQSFYVNPYALIPFETTSSGHRNAAYVTWFIYYYLSPEYNALYKPTGVITKGEWFFYDYLICMGFNPSECQPRSLQDWCTFFASPASSADGWIQTRNLTDIQQAANDGKTVVVTTQRSDMSCDVSVVVPQSTILEPGEIVTAHCGLENWNYRRILLDDILSDGVVTISIHD